MLETYFANPALLWTLLVVPAALALIVYAFVRKKYQTAQLSSPLLLRRNLLVRRGVRRWQATLILSALTLSALASAGPQWGPDESASVRRGRDVVIVLDLSRSMFAEQPSRRAFALASLRQLADVFETHGGHRIALIGFAGQARLFFPFTQDCDHLRHVIQQIETDDYPRLSAPNAFGTRIGAALALAVQTCDPERGDRPVIVLLSDGDDPAADDEWQNGVNAARERGLPIHVAGFGNPLKAETITLGRDLLEFDGQIVRTKMNETLLRTIAERTGGEYFPAHRTDFALGAFLLNRLDADDLSEGGSAGTLPMLQLRYAWFLLPAALLFLLAMSLGDGKRFAQVTGKTTIKSKMPALAFAVLAALCISAADPPGVELLQRQADEAFAREQYEAALGLYEKVEGLTQDPGRVAFNKGTTYYRLGHFREAIESYRRCLDDDRAPRERRARACFDLGNAIVQQAGESPQQFADAIDAYRAALEFATEQSTWRGDARYNLELAQLLLAKAREKHPEEKIIPKAKPEMPNADKEKSGGKEQKHVLAPVDPTQGFKGAENNHGKSGQKSDQLQTGAIVVLPDTDTVVPQSRADTLTTLQKEADRIRDARRQQYQPSRRGQLSSKDW